MATLEHLREEMQRALEIMDDTTKPFHVRHAARSRFWHCEKRVGTMERSGRIEDEPGHFMIGYSEEHLVREARQRAASRSQESVSNLDAAKKKRAKDKYADLVMQAWADQEHAAKREFLDRKAEVQISARERL